MAEFYGTVTGSRGETSRCGTNTSGIKTSAQSWYGSVITNMNMRNDKLNIRIDLADDSRESFGDIYFDGSLTELKDCFNLYKAFKEAGTIQDTKFVSEAFYEWFEQEKEKNN